MPYYIYRMVPPNKLQHIDTKEKYQDARQLVRTHRVEMQAGEDFSVRMIFAKSQAEAEKLLSLPREKRVIGED